MRYLGPLQFKVHAESESLRQAGLRYEPVARTMIGQMLSFSGGVAVNEFKRQLSDGTRITVWMNREGLEPQFMAQVWPVETHEETQSTEEETSAEPYFCVGLQWVSGGEVISYYDGYSTPEYKDELAQYYRARGVRVVPHLVVWEPAAVEGDHATPVMVKRWANPARPPVWGSGIPGQGPFYFGDEFPVLSAYFAENGFINYDVPGALFMNYRQNAYWWLDSERNRWRYHFFSRSENGLVVWEYDNLGRDPYTPHPAYPDDPAETYLSIAEMNPQGREEGRDYDEVTFTSYPYFFSGWGGTFPDPDDWYNGESQKAYGSGWAEALVSTTEPLEPTPPDHAATTIPGGYLVKVVVEGPTLEGLVEFTPVTVRLVVDSGMTPAGVPKVRDEYEITIASWTSARRILYPGGYWANPELRTFTAQPPYNDPFQPVLDFGYDYGENLGGPAWSSETIFIDPMGGSSLTDEQPWGVGNADPGRYCFSATFLTEPRNAYRNLLNSFFNDPSTYL